LRLSTIEKELAIS